LEATNIKCGHDLPAPNELNNDFINVHHYGGLGQPNSNFLWVEHELASRALTSEEWPTEACQGEMERPGYFIGCTSNRQRPLQKTSGSERTHHPTTKRSKFPRDPTRLKAGVCMRPCKVFGPDRTKMFHVKHFCPIGGPNRT
jgi:hypothetical protein